jgi:ABC-2 type transport system ATP-binding protein
VNANQIFRAAETGDIGSFAVSTTNLIKEYEREAVLRSVNLRVPTGSAYLLAGTNGAGKSTLIRLLLNLEKPSSGSAMVSGLDPQRFGPAVRVSTGYVSEEIEPGYSWMRAEQLFEHRARLYPTWDRAYASHLVALLDVRMDKVIGKLSKGQARRVQLVGALAYRPSLLLLDEPTDGFDPIVRDKVLELLSAHLAETNCTTVISTHLASEVDQLVDHVGVLHRGQLLCQGTRDSLMGSITRYEIEAPRDWHLPSNIASRPLRLESGLGRSRTLVIQGDRGELEVSLQRCGATVRAKTGLSLSEAVLFVLKNGDGQ